MADAGVGFFFAFLSALQPDSDCEFLINSHKLGTVLSPLLYQFSNLVFNLPVEFRHRCDSHLADKETEAQKVRWLLRKQQVTTEPYRSASRSLSVGNIVWPRDRVAMAVWW